MTDLSIDGPIHGKTNGRSKTVTAKGPKAAKTLHAGAKLVSRRYTTAGVDPLTAVEYDRRDSVISNPDGSVVFATRGAEIPRSWSQLATDIVVSKYFRRAGLHGDATKGETSVRQVVYRIAHTIREAGEARGYFVDAASAETFEAELSHLMVNQYGAFNSPVWFNCGLFQRYGITGSGGNWAWDDATGTVTETASAYERPQCSACFIQSAGDDLMSIFELVKNEARLFKYGSGTGSNFSALRGRQEKLSGGGTSSGLMSFLEVFDRAAGSTKSGGTTRRAAKMVCLDMDHPEIVDFIEWKMREEKKAQALIAQGYPSDFNGEAYHTVSGQNSNNSVRVTDAFMSAVERDGEWQTRMRTTGKVCETLKAKDLWRKVADSAWHCADPGVQYDTTINDWHTCPNSGRINASNPCVTGDTLVATADGMRRIDAMLETPAEVVGADGELHPIKPAFATGVKPVYRLRTASGFELNLTADHRVMTANRGDVPVCELTRDDRVLLGRPAFGRASVDARLAEFIGLVVGDGCLMGDQETAMVTLSPDEEAVARSAVQRLNAFKRENAADARAARETEVTRPQGTLRLGTSARCVVDPIKRYAHAAEGSAQKRFTDDVFALDRASIAALLRGLFTADGTVADYGDKSQYVALDSTSHALLLQVQQMLLGFGIKARIYRDRRVLGQTTALLPDGKGGRKEYPVQQIHSLRVARDGRVAFEREVGFLEGSPKTARLAAMNASVSAYRDRMDDRVESLELLGDRPVYDLTEPVTHHFVANGLVVHNCSEYMFLDDTACNLSSLNLTKFLRDLPSGESEFDVEGYRHAARIFFLAQEILVDLSSYPTKTIAQNSHDYRPLGLGYANLGTLLMVMGLAYDSDAGRAVAGALTAILTGQAFRVSSEIAAQKGPFAGYAKNRDPMLRVMRKHRDAAYKIDEALCPTPLLRAAREDWDEAVKHGEQYGYRNAQATVLAPTGTIGLLMDCDTTGIEPDFSVVKYKKLAGGGYFKIVNASVERALKRLGYSAGQIAEIIAYVVGTNTFLTAPAVNREYLKGKGFTAEDIQRVEAALPGAFTIEMAFAPHVLGADLVKRLGVEEDSKTPGFSLLAKWGLSRAEIDTLGDHVLGRSTTEGAAHLRPEHYAVFDCANRCGKHGTRFIAPIAHVKMMAATQPFLSGAISKTVNLPNEATVDEIANIYQEGWKLGLKAVALYRDGCKASQPLSSSGDKKEDKKAEAKEPVKVEVKEVVKSAATTTTLPVATGSEAASDFGPLFAKAPTLGPQRNSVRYRLPKKRRGFTQEARIAGHKVFLRTGEYEDGQLGEIFIDMHKEGAAFRSLMNSFAIAVSMGLQHGVSLAEYVDQFSFTRFEPQGPVEGHPNIKFSTSIIDYVFRVLGVEYLQRYDLAHVRPEEANNDAQQQLPGESTPSATPTPAHGSAIASMELSARNQSALDRQLGKMMGDAPFCDNCGHITVRNGACYRCLNCGSSMGCS